MIGPKGKKGTNPMKYSQILGAKYHKIFFNKYFSHIVDLYFSGAGHHYWRREESRRNQDAYRFHDFLFSQHLYWLMKTVYENGDFSNATDPSGLGLHHRINWYPRYNGVLPDPVMFKSIAPFKESKLEQFCPNDIFLKSIEMMSEDNELALLKELYQWMFEENNHEIDRVLDRLVGIYFQKIYPGLDKEVDLYEMVRQMTRVKFRESAERVVLEIGSLRAN
jgi:hypothetical protein